MGPKNGRQIHTYSDTQRLERHTFYGFRIKWRNGRSLVATTTTTLSRKKDEKKNLF